MAGPVMPGGSPVVTGTRPPTAGTGNGATTPASAPVAAPAKRKSFLASLKPIETLSPVTPILIVGNKGVKTISAVGVGIEGTPALPFPKEGKVVVITFDHMTALSMKNHYGSTTRIGEKDVEVYGLMSPSDDGSYPGFDGARPESAIDVVDAFRELLVHLRDSRNVGLLVIDHYGIFIDVVGKYYAYAKARVSIDSKLEPGQWTSRSNLFVEIDHLIRNTPMPGGIVIATGSREVNDGQEKTTFTKNAAGKMVTAVETVPAKWVAKIQHNWPNIIQGYKGKMANGGAIVRYLEVEECRCDFLPPAGSRVNIDGRHIGAFLDEAAVQLPEAVADAQEQQ